MRISDDRSLVALAVLVGGFFGLPGCLHDRDGWQQPAQVIDRLEIEPGDRVADLGSGDGYFTFRLAEAVGGDGKVFAVDVDEDALAEVAKNADERGVTNVQTIRAAEDDANLAPGGVDLIFLCNTYHHLPNQADYFRRLTPSLSERGRVAIIELDDLPWLYELFLGGHMTNAEAVRETMAQAGYRLETAHDFLAHQNFQVFVVATAPKANDD